MKCSLNSTYIWYCGATGKAKAQVVWLCPATVLRVMRRHQLDEPSRFGAVRDSQFCPEKPLKRVWVCSGCRYPVSQIQFLSSWV